MAKTNAEELKKIAEKNKIIFGSNEILRKLKKGLFSRVYLASNVPKKVEDEINYSASISKTDIKKLDIPNDELGVVFKRPHVLLAVAVLKDSN